MKPIVLIKILWLFFTWSLLSCSSSQPPEFSKTVVWESGEGNVEGYRIPGIVVTGKGTVLAFAEARVDYRDETPNHLVLKRSEDGGKTWSNTIYIEKSDGSYWAEHKDEIASVDNVLKKEVWTNVAPIVDKVTNRIFFFYALNEGSINGKNLQRYTKVFYKYSDDDGCTWSVRKEITDLLNVNELGKSNLDENGNPVLDMNGFPCDYRGRAFHMPGPGHGIQLSSGRLLLQVWSRTALGKVDEAGVFQSIPIEERRYGMSTLYSDDHGETWQYGSSFGENVRMGEARMVELDNGDVYMNSRYTSEEKNNYRATAISHDGGKKWTDISIDKNFPLSNQCDAGLIELKIKETSYLLYCKNESTEGRKNLVLKYSSDNGKSWSTGKSIDQGSVSYSDLAVLPDNTILILYETGKQKPMYCARVNMSTIIQQSPKVICNTGDIPDIPLVSGLGGAFSGVHNDVLIVVGGSFFDKPVWEGGKKIYTDSIYVCVKEKNKYVWTGVGKLPHSVAHGVSVQTENGLLCIGGKTDKQFFSDVWLLQWDVVGKDIVINKLPSLPEACAFPAGAMMNGYVYVTGGCSETPMKNFWRLDIKCEHGKCWETLDPVPWAERYGAILVEQSNGENNCLYLLGGQNISTYLTDMYCYNPSKPSSLRWEKMPEIPRPVFGAPAISYKTSSFFVFSGSDGHDTDKVNDLKDHYQFISDILSFNTITKQWYVAGNLPYGIVNTTPVFWQDKIYLPAGELRPSVRTSSIISVLVQDREKAIFTFADYVSLITYLILIVWLGYYFSSKNKSSKDFFLGGQKIPFWAAGLSMMAAQVSAIGFMSIPAKSFVTNWSYFAGVLTWFIVVPLVIYAFVPFYRRLNVTSAYEYLEKRFNVFIRKFIAALYLLFQLLGRLGAVIFLPALALSAVTGMNTIVCIVIIGGLSTLYTVMGGMHAVIWIDVIQALVLFGAIFLCIGCVVLNIEGGVGEIIRIAASDGKFSFGRMDMDLTAAVFWVIVIGNIFNRLGSMATDQSVVQRYLTTRNEKETAKALWTDALVSIPWALCVFGLGTALYVFYKVHPDLLNPSITNDEIVPFFIGQNLPVGISGIVIAGIFAASMSSVDSSIHSSTTVIMRDFMQGCLTCMTEKQNVYTARWITAGIGIMGTLIALIMTFFDINSVWDIILEFAGLFTGAMTGVFILGIFSTKANGGGAVIGTLASAILLLAIKTFTALNFFLYSGIGIVSCIVIGYLASFMFKSRKSIEGLTIYSVEFNKKN